MRKCNFNKVTRCSPVNLLHILRTPSPKNTSERLLLMLFLLVILEQQWFLLKYF